MKLADLRRLAIRKQLRIRFDLSEHGECLIDEHGTAKVPSLRAVPSFNLEEMLVGVTRFRLEQPDVTGGKISLKQTSLAELEQLVSSLSPAAVAAADHDE
ncbi:MAG: hypothetical protein HY820_27475 [Acidobacteria bacterium]|nr:hypothetical protein [Acidobacteriota bacterium]